MMVPIHALQWYRFADTVSYYAGFNEDKPVDDYEYQLKEIHLKLQDIFVSLASESQLLDYLIFMLRVQMKKVEKQDGIR